MEGVVQDVVLALGQLKFLIGCCENVMPQLAIFAGLVHQLLHGVIETFKVHCGRQSCSVVDIIYESQQVNGCLNASIRCGVGGSSCCLGAVEVIQSA